MDGSGQYVSCEPVAGPELATVQAVAGWAVRHPPLDGASAVLRWPGGTSPGL